MLDWGKWVAEEEPATGWLFGLPRPLSHHRLPGPPARQLCLGNSTIPSPRARTLSAFRVVDICAALGAGRSARGDAGVAESVPVPGRLYPTRIRQRVRVVTPRATRCWHRHLLLFLAWRT